MFERIENLRMGQSDRLLLATVIAAFIPLICCTASGIAVAETAGVTVSDNTAQASATVRYSPGIPDILKMVDAKVDVGIITAYIRNAPVAYNPSANEIILLKERGVGDEIITAIIQRGGELRAPTAQSQPSPTVTAPSVPYGNAPAYDYGAPSAYPYADGYP